MNGRTRRVAPAPHDPGAGERSLASPRSFPSSLDDRRPMGVEPFSGIIFGFEGTLAELDPDLGMMERQVCALAGAFLEREVSPGGLSVHERTVAVAGELYGIRPALGREFLSRCGMLMTDAEMKAAGKGRLFPFTPGILSFLRNRRRSIGIISGSCTAAVKALFPGIETACDVFLAREVVGRVRPHPAHILRAVGALGLPPKRCLMVTDNPREIEAARRAGTACAAVSGGRTGGEALGRARPMFVSGDVPELVHHLASLDYL